MRSRVILKVVMDFMKFQMKNINHDKGKGG